MIMVSISKPYSTLDVPLPSSPRRRKRIFLKTCYAATDHKSNVSGFAQYCLERRDPSPTFHSKTNIRHNILKKTCHQDEENAKPAPVINIGRFSDNTGGERGRGGGGKKKNTGRFHRFVAQTWQRYLLDHRGSEDIFFSFLFSPSFLVDP